MSRSGPMRVLYSFPQRLGAGRICYTAWQQVLGLHAAGASVTVLAGSVARPVPPEVEVRTTLSVGPARLPLRLVGVTRACELHDRIVARQLPRLADRVDVLHLWPRGARHTLRVARELGIPTFLERPNAHTRFAYDVVARESARLGVVLPPGSEHAYDPHVLRIEEAEFRLADRLLCPSDFVVRSFLDQGTPADKLVRHTYGVDLERFGALEAREPGRPFTALFVGHAAVRKGLHVALEAWLSSPLAETGELLVAGTIVPEYEALLRTQLAHPSVHVLGHREDIPDLMRRSDVMLLPSFEEGFGLVCVEAMAAGSVPLVSDACTDLCRHDDNALVHPAGDAVRLREHLTELAADPARLRRLRDSALSTAPGVTWRAAGRRLLDVYTEYASV
ncbi:glycosyltransferase family 4 protein [Georgenia sp. 311]|uniref:glycosyltransferase family 4 protein n=1 Tax=Georgenia sp. 311 TaxID=2585134 RepID=UPI001C3F330A|nr:glycosyltransferase family 4 protein [Georgenia sp. 311]